MSTASLGRIAGWAEAVVEASVDAGRPCSVGSAYSCSDNAARHLARLASSSMRRADSCGQPTQVRSHAPLRHLSDQRPHERASDYAGLSDAFEGARHMQDVPSQHHRQPATAESQSTGPGSRSGAYLQPTSTLPGLDFRVRLDASRHLRTLVSMEAGSPTSLTDPIQNCNDDKCPYIGRSWTRSRDPGILGRPLHSCRSVRAASTEPSLRAEASNGTATGKAENQPDAKIPYQTRPQPALWRRWNIWNSPFQRLMAFTGSGWRSQHVQRTLAPGVIVALEQEGHDARYPHETRRGEGTSRQLRCSVTVIPQRVSERSREE